MNKNILHRFEPKICLLCGSNDMNEFFETKGNFIEYSSGDSIEYHSLFEIFTDVLNFDIQYQEIYEVCSDCKDKMIKFYNFKRKVKKILCNKKDGLLEIDYAQKSRKKSSKTVRNICEIVENYAQKYSIVTIKVKESDKKLIIEPKQQNDILEMSKTQLFNTSMTIKEEPESELSENSNTSIIWKCSGVQDPYQSSKLDLHEVTIKQEEAGDPSSATFINLPENYIDEPTYECYVEGDRSVSKAALKMRKYREKLKLPENREKFLEHKERQKFWNRRHYLRKQARSSQSSRSSNIYNDFDNYFVS